MRNFKWALAPGVFLLLTLSNGYAQTAKPGEGGQTSGQSQQKAPPLDPRADQILKDMSRYLQSLPSFSIDTYFTTEVVLVNGEKLNYNGQSRVLVDRHYGIRTDRYDRDLDGSLFYDRKKLSFYRRDAGTYGTTEAPADMDAAIDFAREKLGLEAPAADLLYSDPYSFLTKGLTSTSYLGVEGVRGVPAHHLALRGGNVDVQIWVQDGAVPLPVKYVITTLDVKGAPQYSVDLENWNVAPRVSADMFTFVPLPGAKQVPFKNLPAWSSGGVSQFQLDKKKGA